MEFKHYFTDLVGDSIFYGNSVYESNGAHYIMYAQSPLKLQFLTEFESRDRKYLELSVDAINDRTIRDPKNKADRDSLFPSESIDYEGAPCGWGIACKRKNTASVIDALKREWSSGEEIAQKLLSLPIVEAGELQGDAKEHRKRIFDHTLSKLQDARDDLYKHLLLRMTSETDLRAALVGMDGAKSLLRAYLEIGFPYETIYLDDLHAMLFGTHGLYDSDLTKEYHWNIDPVSKYASEMVSRMAQSEKVLFQVISRVPLSGVEAFPNVLGLIDRLEDVKQETSP